MNDSPNIHLDAGCKLHFRIYACSHAYTHTEKKGCSQGGWRLVHRRTASSLHGKPHRALVPIHRESPPTYSLLCSLIGTAGVPLTPPVQQLMHFIIPRQTD